MRDGPDGFGWWWSLAKDPDSKPPHNGFQRVMNAFHGVYEWTGTAEFLVSLSASEPAPEVRS